MMSKNFKETDEFIRTSLSERYLGTELPIFKEFNFRNQELLTFFKKHQSFDKVFTHLLEKGTFDFAFEQVEWRDTDGETQLLTINRASKTPLWPMGTHFWVRDNAIIGSVLLELDYDSFPYPIEWLTKGKEILLSTLTIISSESQLQRFRSIISDEKSVSNPHHWPHIFLSIDDNINAVNDEPWMHKQDAWQILAYHVLVALENKTIQWTELSSKHIQFLNLICPFLKATNFTHCPNGGSWEEIDAVRTSVISWETALLKRITCSDYISHPDAESLLELGIQKLRLNYQKECPDYSIESVQYRDADSSLIYLLMNDTPQLINAQAPLPMVDSLIEKILSLRGMSGFRRYLKDSYQGLNYYNNEITQQLNDLYQSPSGDSSGVDQFKQRFEIVPSGHEAEWTHFVWQLSSACGGIYKTTQVDKYKELQYHFLFFGLSLITGKDELTIAPTENNKMSTTAIQSYRIPECYNSETVGEHIIQYPSHHTPLYWSVAEALRAFNQLIT